jgi:hypothetical protein
MPNEFRTGASSPYSLLELSELRPARHRSAQLAGDQRYGYSRLWAWPGGDRRALPQVDGGAPAEVRKEPPNSHLRMLAGRCADQLLASRSPRMSEPRNRVVQMSRYGGPEGLELIEAPMPTGAGNRPSV